MQKLYLPGLHRTRYSQLGFLCAALPSAQSVSLRDDDGEGPNHLLDHLSAIYEHRRS